MKPQVVRAFQVLWVLLLGFGLYILVLRVNATLAHSLSVCTKHRCPSDETTLLQARLARSAGLPVNIIAIYDAGFGILFESAFFLVGGLIIWRKPGDRMALFTAFFLVVMGGVAASSDPKVPAGTPHVAYLLANFLAAVGLGAMFVFFYLFPDGRPVRPRLGAFLVVCVVLQSLPLPPPPPGPLGLIGLVIFFGPFATVIYTQIYRYRNISTPGERQQTKWVVYGLTVGIVGFMLTAALSNLSAAQASLPAEVLVVTGLYGFFMLIPLTIGFAILRNRLYDVDLLINRTLVYGSLTISLAGLYIGGVIAIEALARGLTGQNSELAVAIVTLAIAALFNPWHRRIQSFIDQRFYRRRYDAARTLAAFQATLRDQVELTHLVDEILVVTQETVQPTSLSLWLPGGSDGQ